MPTPGPIASPAASGRQVSASTTVPAPPEDVFDLLAHPARHALVDGSGTVRAQVRGPDRVGLGDRFAMRMRLGVPYVIGNEVVEFEEGRRIAWRHVGRHVWRYTLEPAAAPGGDPAGWTTVTETFDWAPARAPRVLELLRVPARNERVIHASLRRLHDHFAT